MKISNRTYRPSTPVVPEDDIPTEPVKPDPKPDPKPEPKPEKPSRTDPPTPARPLKTPAQTARDLFPSPESRYRDTALEIHRDKRLPEPPAVNKRLPESPVANKRRPESPAAKRLTADGTAANKRRSTASPTPAPNPRSPRLTGRVEIKGTKSPERAMTRNPSGRADKTAAPKKVTSYHEGKRFFSCNYHYVRFVHIISVAIHFCPR